MPVQITVIVSGQDDGRNGTETLTLKEVLQELSSFNNSHPRAELRLTEATTGTLKFTGHESPARGQGDAITLPGHPGGMTVRGGSGQIHNGPGGVGTSFGEDH